MFDLVYFLYIFSKEGKKYFYRTTLLNGCYFIILQARTQTTL